MSRKLALIATVAFFVIAHQAAAGPVAEAETGDAAKIYTAFLDGWTGKDKNPVNVSITAEAPTAEELKEFSDCAENTHWEPVESIENLTGLIGKLAYVHLVDSSKWSPSDPGDLIAQGHPVESAVKSGIDHGLVTFSAVAFDESHTTAAFTFSFVCGGLCGSGRTVIYKLTSTGWAESNKQCGGWISQVQGGRPNNSFKPNLLRYTKHMAG